MKTYVLLRSLMEAPYGPDVLAADDDDENKARGTKSKDPQPSFNDWDDLFREPNITPSSKQPPNQDSPKKAKLSTASASKTRRKMAGVQLPPEAANLMRNANLAHPDEISDTQARINAGADDNVDDSIDDRNQIMPRPTPNTLPAVISTAIMKNGNIVPEWHMVKHLPGYLQSGIRSIGRAVFSPFTKTPIEQIQVIANVGGTGPNTKQEVNAIMGFLQKTGNRDPVIEMKFQDRIPGYSAHLKVYTALGYTFVACKDFAGEYVYAWPASDGDGLVSDVEPIKRPRLR